MRLTLKTISIQRPRGLRDAFGLRAAECWLALYAPFVPVRTGHLRRTVTVTPWRIAHTAPYAACLYHGTRRGLPPTPWDRLAAPTRLPALAQALQAEVNCGNGPFEY